MNFNAPVYFPSHIESSDYLGGGGGDHFADLFDLSEDPSQQYGAPFYSFDTTAPVNISEILQATNTTDNATSICFSSLINPIKLFPHENDSSEESSVTIENENIKTESTSKKERKYKPWSAEEDATIVTLVNEYLQRGLTPIWEQIAKKVSAAFKNQRNTTNTKYRYTESLQSNFLRGKFSSEEDSLLKTALLPYKDSDRKISWVEIAKMIPTRSADKLRRRAKVLKLL